MVKSRPRSGSIVIPAHDEARVIKRCLDALLSNDWLDGVDIVVACNGCTDGTADLARTAGQRVAVLENEVASKAAALRDADRRVGSFPRIYLDADVVLPARSASDVLAALETGPALAARPPVRFDTTRSTWPVRRYYAARARVPSLMTSLWGAGVYALAADGRARFDEFPDLVADDLFVDRLFDRGEILIVPTEPVIVTAPRTLWALVTVLRRTYRGNAQQRTEGDRTTSSSTVRQVLATARAPNSAVDAIMYLTIATTARAIARFRAAPRWERDDSSRED